MSNNPPYYQDYSSNGDGFPSPQPQSQPSNNPYQYAPLTSFRSQPHFQGQALKSDTSFRDSYHSGISTNYDPSKNGSTVALNTLSTDETSHNRNYDYSNQDDPYLNSTQYTYSPRKKSHKKKWSLIGLLITLLLIGLGAGLGVYFYLNSNKNDNNDSIQKDTNGDGIINKNDDNNPIKQFKSGSDGSEILMENGQSFVYRNSFGGSWNEDPEDFSARSQSYTPPLSEEFDYASDRILGVNIGGWLLTEPFIVPALYEPYENTSSPVMDEYDLSLQYISEGGQELLESKMREHYDTFITEEDFAMIAGAGLNWIRLPIGFWAVETIGSEPFLEGVSWEYVLKAITWARKYGLRINLDLHAVPGSQNGYNHSGKQGTVGWLQGKLGLVNGQRSLNYLRIITEFISRPDISPVVPMLSIVNELKVTNPDIGIETAMSWSAEAYETIRNVTGYGKGNGPYVVLHDGFTGFDAWNGFLNGADRVAWDFHPYMAFNGDYSTDWETLLPRPCQWYAQTGDAASISKGVTIAGEFSLAINDCGLFLNDVGGGNRFEGTHPSSNGRGFGSCSTWDDWSNWDSTRRTNFQHFMEVQIDSLKNFFFWTWRTGDSLRNGKSLTPMWNYKLGLQEGWMPNDPHGISRNIGTSNSACSQVGSPLSDNWNGIFSNWMTGGSERYSTVDKDQHPWPPATIRSMEVDSRSLPVWTKTGTPIQLPTFSPSGSIITTSTPIATYNPNDLAPWYVEVEGCNYPPTYEVTDWTPQGWPCNGAQAEKRNPSVAVPTSIPK